MSIKAELAGKGLSVIATKLLTHEIVEPEGFTVLQRVATEISKHRASMAWTFEIDRGLPVVFSRVLDKNGRGVVPRMVVPGISVDQEYAGHSLPFTAFDIAIEIDSDDGTPVARWHVDLANKIDGVYQDGPLMHLQFGGHNQGFRELDHPLKVPRWCHPPLDVALVCEVIAANFFTEKWLELREDPSWCDAIALFQRLCFTAYIEKLTASLSVSSKTALHTMWASSWGG